MERKITNDVVTEIGLTQRNKTLTLEGDVAVYDLRGMKKEFPNITTLKIKNGVTAIRISNRTFPNIRKVISESPLFETKETMLIRTSKLKSEKGILLNAFCKSEEETLYFKNVAVIADMALDGCDTKKVFNTEHLTCINKDGLSGSAFDLNKAHPGSGPIMFGDCLIGFNDDTGSYELTKDVKYIIFPEGFSGSKLERLVVKDYKLLSVLNGIGDAQICDTLYIDDITDFREAFGSNEICLNAKHVQINDENNYLKSQNDMIFDKKGGILYDSAWFLSGNAVIPDGVKTIRTYAFSSPYIASVEFPASVTNIQSGAFLNADNVTVIQYNGENVPHGCIEAFARNYEPYPDDKNTVIKIVCNKGHVFLPRYMTEKSIKKLDKICNEEFATLKKAYQYAINEEVRQDTMIREYAFSKDKNIAAYLKDDIKSIVLRYIQEDRESDAIVAVNIGMLLEDDLREIKSVAENASMRELILKINNTLS